MRILPGISALGIFAAILAASARPQETPRPPQGGVPIKVTISVAGKPGAPALEIHQDEVTVKQDGIVRPIVSWLPANDPAARLNLVFLLDPFMSSRTVVLWGQIQDFIRSLPEGSRVAFAHADRGRAVIDQNFSTDLDLAAKSLKFPTTIADPTSGFNAAVADLCQKWPNTHGRRVLLTVGPGDWSNADRALEQALRAGIVIYALFAPNNAAKGPNVDDYASITLRGFDRAGMHALHDMAGATGGKSFDSGQPSAQEPPQLPMSYKPFLEELSSLLKQSYVATFLAEPQAKEEKARFEASVSAKGVTVKAPSHVFVPAPGAAH